MKNYNDNEHLVFLPGWGFKASVWEPCAKKLALPFVCLELPDNVTSLPDAAMQIDKQIPQSCTLVAWSLSGLLATYLCANNPRKYKKLVTVCSSPKFIADKNWPGISITNFKFLLQKTKDNPDYAMKKFHQWANPSHACLFSSMVPFSSSLILYLQLLQQCDLRQSYSGLTIPVLHLFGEKDILVPAQLKKIIHDNYSTHTVKLIANSGHIPFITHEEIFLNHLNQFIHQGPSYAQSYRSSF